MTMHCITGEWTSFGGVIHENTNIYVNDSLCPYYRGLWNGCKKLWNNKKIYFYFIVSVTKRINQVENGPYKSITHVNNLRALFPE